MHISLWSSTLTSNQPHILDPRKPINKQLSTCSAGAVRSATRLKAVHLNLDALKPQALFLIRQKLLHIFALIALQLDDFTHLGIGYDGAIARELLLDHLEDLFLVEFLGQALDGCQGFAAVALCEVERQG
jgi:hypothetical protein